MSLTAFEQIQNRYETQLAQEAEALRKYREFYDLDSYKLNYNEDRDFFEVVNAKKPQPYKKPYVYTDTLLESIEDIIYTLQTFLQAEKELREIHIPQAEEYLEAQRLHWVANFSLHSQGLYNDAILQTQRRIISLRTNIKELRILRKNTLNFQTSINQAFEHIKGCASCKIVEYEMLKRILTNNLDVWTFGPFILSTRDESIANFTEERLTDLEAMKSQNEDIVKATESLQAEFFEILETSLEEMDNDLNILNAELATCLEDLRLLGNELEATILNEGLRKDELMKRLELLQEFRAWLEYVQKDFDFVFDKYPQGWHHILFSHTQPSCGWAHFSSLYPKRNDSRINRGGRNGKK